MTLIIDVQVIYTGEPNSELHSNLWLSQKPDIVSSTWIWPMSQLGETTPTEQYSSQVPTPGLSSIG